MKDFLKGSLLGKIVGTIIAFVWILNLIPTGYGSEEIFSNSFILKIVTFIVAVIFGIPGIIISIGGIGLAK